MTATDKGRRHYPIWGGQGGLSSKVTSEQSPEGTYGERKTRTLCSMTVQEGVTSEELEKPSGKQNFDSPRKLFEKDQVTKVKDY